MSTAHLDEVGLASENKFQCSDGTAGKSQNPDRWDVWIAEDEHSLAKVERPSAQQRSGQCAASSLCRPPKNSLHL